MGLSIGIVGLPNVGKSTLFNALTRKSVPAENYPFCTIDPSIGIVAVPDPRLERLSVLSGSKKVIPAVIEFVDIAGLVKGASEGAGLGNQFLSHIREVDAILEVVRIFEDSDIIHVEGEINPVRDIEIVNLELILSDMQVVSKRIAGIERDAKRGDKAALLEQSALKKADALLSEGKLAKTADFTEGEAKVIRTLQLLTMKPIMYVLNKKAGGHNLDEMKDPRYAELLGYMESINSVYLIADAAIEGELNDVAKEDKENLRREFGVLDDGIDELIRSAYRLLGLMSYFTTGEDETRGWTVKVGSSAPQAGAAIHTDFEEKFIRAEVVPADRLLEAGSYAAARERGWVRTEGKEYIVKDGDVIEFRI